MCASDEATSGKAASGEAASTTGMQSQQTGSGSGGALQQRADKTDQAHGSASAAGGPAPAEQEPASGWTDPPVSRSKKRRQRRRRKRADVRAGQGLPQSANETPTQKATQPLGRHAGADMHGAQKANNHVYAAIDLGTNNCRLLIARRSHDGFRVIDAYSRIVRLGEGLAHTGRLSDEAMDRALAALAVCADKMKRRGVTRVRSIATEACRTAENGAAFVTRVFEQTGIDLNIVSTEDEANLALSGCSPLLDPEHEAALVFDIGGGSTELMWVSHDEGAKPVIRDWTSLPCGVVTLAETYGGAEVSNDLFEQMVGDVTARLKPFLDRVSANQDTGGHYHLLGTSGTVTTIAGVHLGLKRYDRAKVDGVWVRRQDVAQVTNALLEMNLAERAAHPCVGQERADLVLAGCAILEAISRAWPSDRLRVADRGLREGILFSLMKADEGRSRRRRRRRRGKPKQPPTQAVSQS